MSGFSGFPMTLQDPQNPLSVFRDAPTGIRILLAVLQPGEQRLEFPDNPRSKP